jgi:hypothetical protein
VRSETIGVGCIETSSLIPLHWVAESRIQSDGGFTEQQISRSVADKSAHLSFFRGGRAHSVITMTPKQSSF